MKELEEHQRYVAIYHGLGCLDRHLIRLLHWHGILESLIEEMRECEMDLETEEELRKILNRWTMELGVRLKNAMPVGKE